MTDPIEPTPEEIAAANLLNFAKQQAVKDLHIRLNGLTHNGLSRYPQAEVQSWPYQRPEAYALEAAGEGATLAMAPLLTQVCYWHYGEADDATRLQQVLAKAAAVRANDAAWLPAAAFVNGTRARTEDAIEAATTPTEVSDALTDAINQIEAFRQAAGI